MWRRRARACTSASVAAPSCSTRAPSSSPAPAGRASPSPPTSSTSNYAPTTASSCAAPRSSARAATPTSGTSSRTARSRRAGCATASTAARWTSRLTPSPEIAELHGQRDRLGSGIDLELGDRVAHVGVDGRRAELKPFGDLFDPQPLGQQLEDLALPRRELEQFLDLG